MSHAPVDRRTVLKVGGALAALTLAGCSDTEPVASTQGAAAPTSAPTSASSAAAGTPTTSATPTATSTSTTTATPRAVSAATADWTAFRRGLEGKLYRPTDSGYAASHQLFNPRWDTIHPVGVVRAASVNDVREAVLFARKNGLRCVPKSGGHSYVGASTVSAGLVIDVGSLRGISYANNIATVGAGARTYDIHVALDKHGRSLPTGTCPTVGIAGITLGGGEGVHTRTYGLTCDRVVSMQVVTADGVARTVSATQDPDLFWALRGGGGGNFAIVTSLRLSTIPGTKLGFFRLSWPASKSAAVVRGWQRFATAAPATAWGNLHIDAAGSGSPSLHVLGVSTTGSAAAAAAQLESLVGSRASSRSLTVRSHLAAVRYLGGGTTSPRTGFLAGSDVLRGPMSAATINAVLAAVRAGGRAGLQASAIIDPLGGQAAKQPAGGSAWPWRSALGVLQWYAGAAAHPTAVGLKPAQNWIAAGHKAVASVSAGAYVNYVEAGRPVSAYYGGNLARLRSVKKKYDPQNFFRSGYAIQ